MFYLNLNISMDSSTDIRSPCFILTSNLYGLLGWQWNSGYLDGWKDSLDGNGTLDILMDGRTAWMAMVLWIS